MIGGVGDAGTPIRFSVKIGEFIPKTVDMERIVARNGPVSRLLDVHPGRWFRLVKIFFSNGLRPIKGRETEPSGGPIVDLAARLLPMGKPSNFPPLPTFVFPPLLSF